MINAVRRENSGIRRGRVPATLRLSDVLRELKPLTSVNCDRDVCHITSVCRLKQALHQAVQHFLQELGSDTLADRVKENPPPYQLLLVE